MKLIGIPTLQGNDRKKISLEEITFVDSEGVPWIAPANIEVDGASIPRFFWRAIGGPFSGKYLAASIIHDYFCVTKSRSSKRVHRMFFECMLHCEVPWLKAKMMYLAVRIGGPDFPANARLREKS